MFAEIKIKSKQDFTYLCYNSDEERSQSIVAFIHNFSKHTEKCLVVNRTENSLTMKIIPHMDENSIYYHAVVMVTGVRVYRATMNHFTNWQILVKSTLNHTINNHKNIFLQAGNNAGGISSGEKNVLENEL